YDGIASFTDLMKFFEKLPNPDKQFAVMPGIAHASLQQKNYAIVHHILLSFFTQPEPIYRGEHKRRSTQPFSVARVEEVSRYQELNVTRTLNHERHPEVRPRGDLAPGSLEGATAPLAGQIRAASFEARAQASACAART